MFWGLRLKVSEGKRQKKKKMRNDKRQRQRLKIEGQEWGVRIIRAEKERKEDEEEEEWKDINFWLIFVGLDTTFIRMNWHGW